MIWLMIPITNFRAHWQPQTNTFGIEIKLQNGQIENVPVPTPEAFIAILSLLNGPSPALAPGNTIVCQR
jgi:hypothetical protein